MQNLEVALAKGSHLIRHVKKDGTEVTRLVTLDPAMVPRFEPKTQRVTHQSLDTVKVWDLRKLGFVTLFPDSVEILPH